MVSACASRQLEREGDSSRKTTEDMGVTLQEVRGGRVKKGHAEHLECTCPRECTEQIGHKVAINHLHEVVTAYVLVPMCVDE